MTQSTGDPDVDGRSDGVKGAARFESGTGRGALTGSAADVATRRRQPASVSAAAESARGFLEIGLMQRGKQLGFNEVTVGFVWPR